MRGPEICFLTPIYHLNVNPFFDKGQNLGHVSAFYLNCWTPNSTIKEALVELFTIFYGNNPVSP